MEYCHFVGNRFTALINPFPRIVATGEILTWGPGGFMLVHSSFTKPQQNALRTSQQVPSRKKRKADMSWRGKEPPTACSVGA